MPDLPQRQAFEDKLQRGVEGVLKQAQRYMVDALYREGLTASDLSSMPDDVQQRFTQNMVDMLQPILEDVYISASQNFASIIGFGVNTDAIGEQAQAWSLTHSQRIASEMLNTTIGRLTQYAAQAGTTSISLAFLRGIVGSALGLGTRNRAQMVATTETSNAISQGETAMQQVLQSDGAIVEKVWYTALDERVCVICAPRHGKIQGSNWTLPPPAHVNCRCYTGYRIENQGQVTIVFDDDAITRRLSQRRARGTRRDQ